MSLIRTQPERHLIDCGGRLNWEGGVAVRSATIEQSFNKPLPFVPTVIYGFKHINVAAKDSPRVALSLPSVTEWGFSLSLKSFLLPYTQGEASTRKDLAVALLNYGAAAQVYFDYNYDANDPSTLVNYDLTDEQKVIDIREAAATTAVTGDGSE